MRIQAVDPSGAVAVEFPSIQAAGRAGYSVQRVHACIHGKAKSHRGYTWRRVDGLRSLPQFVAERIVVAPGKWLSIDAAYKAFIDWLPVRERRVDMAEFQTAFVSMFDTQRAGSVGYAELRAA